MVMDLQGKKMSKSLGNGIDPFEVIERHGADSLRYTMVAIVSPNQNLKLGFPKTKESSETDSFEIGSKFANKIWNASRYILMNIPEGFKETPLDKIKTDIFDRWILSEFNKTIKAVGSALESARFNDAALGLQGFFWREYCDWYVELTKSKIFGGDETVKNDTLSILVYILREFLKLLHPIMPFITEEIYQTLPDHELSIMTTDYPVHDSSMIDRKSEKSVKKFFDLVYLVRNIRGENNIPPEKKVAVVIKTQDKELLNFCKENEKDILYLTKGVSITIDASHKKGENEAFGAGEICEVFINLEGLIDIEKEIARLTKELEKIKADHDRTSGKLKNENFVSKAPKEVIEKEMAKIEEFKTKMKKLEDNIRLFRK
jgi:valyl-tRNA synthetase